MGLAAQDYREIYHSDSSENRIESRVLGQLKGDNNG